MTPEQIEAERLVLSAFAGNIVKPAKRVAAEHGLPVEATAARVVARDGSGRPALLCRDVGAGRIVLSTYPLEYFAARTAEAGSGSTVKLYSALAAVAGVAPPVSVDDPRVLVDHLQHADGRRFLVAVSVAPEPLEVSVSTAEGSTLADRAGRPVGDRVRLAPYGVAVRRLLTPA